MLSRSIHSNSHSDICYGSKIYHNFPNPLFLAGWGFVVSKRTFASHRKRTFASYSKRTFASYTPYALKGQKLLAQGNALGNYGHKPVAL